MTTQLGLRTSIFLALSSTGLAMGSCGGKAELGPVPVDAAAADARAPEDAGSRDVVTDGGDAPDAPLQCSSGRPPEQTCYTREALERQWYYSPGGSEVPRDAGPPPWDMNGCLPREAVRNDCCNLASRGPTLQDGACCYEFCSGACCGRPFYVDGSPAAAPPEARSDWMLRSDTTCTVPADDLRRRIGEAWLRDARMEHASIASFTQHAEELLSIGAPAEFVREALRFAIDEVHHAELAFGLGSGLLGREFGPGPLPQSTETRGSLADIVAAVARDGCVHETVAAGLALTQLSGATDPSTKRCLETIAADESRHAAFAWRFVAWALARHPDLSGVLAHAFEDALRALPVSVENYAASELVW